MSRATGSARHEQAPDQQREPGAQFEHLPHILSRRQLLRGVALLGGGAALSAFIAAWGAENPTATPPRPAGGVPTLTAAPAATTGAAGAAPTATRGPATPSGGGVPAGTQPAAVGQADSPAVTGSPGAGVTAPPIAQGPKLTRNASFTLWGFGVEETNPRGLARFNAFKEAYPNITIEHVPRIDDQKILTAAASRTLPDVIWLGRTDLSQWAARGVLRAIDDLIQKDKFDVSRFYESARNEVQYDRKTYGIPQFTTVRAMYVNTDALQEAGADANSLNTGDWDQLTSLAGKLVTKSGDKIDRWGFDHKIQAGWLWLWGLANGGTFISDDLKQVSYNDPKIVEALEFGVRNYEAQGGFQDYSAVVSTYMLPQ